MCKDLVTMQSFILCNSIDRTILFHDIKESKYSSRPSEYHDSLLNKVIQIRFSGVKFDGRISIRGIIQAIFLRKIKISIFLSYGTC